MMPDVGGRYMAYALVVALVVWAAFALVRWLA